MTKQFLQEYVEASPSERKLKEALVDKTEAEILRAYELQKNTSEKHHIPLGCDMNR